jgi:hypothetical protein
MAVLGMRGTGSWSTDEAPENFRDKILFLYPNSPAIMTSITGRLKSETTNNPVFNIFEKGLPPMRAYFDLATSDDQGGWDASTSTKFYVQEDASTVGNAQNYFRAGQVIMVERTQEIMWVTGSGTDGTGNYIEVAARGSGVATGQSAAALLADDWFLIIGTRNPEGSDVPEAITHDASTVTNYTQIFRTPLHLTGTAKEIYLRTGDVEAELKRSIAERHAIEQEWSFIFGKKNQTTTSGQYERTTQGFIQRMGSTNVSDFSDVVTKAAWESFLEDIFLVPNSKDEKLCLCGNKALTTLNAMAQAYGQIGLVPTSESYGLKLMRWETPYGTLMLKGHPLLSQNSSFNDWGLVLDMSNIVYRPLKNRDTKFLKDRQGNGVDAVIHEYFTEAGIEFRHASTHGLFKNAAAFQA